MLEALHVRDFVLIGRAQVEFGGGLCVLTGETGAGKSILVDALQAVCGRRLPRSVPAACGPGPEISAEFGVAGNEHVRRWLRDSALEGGESDVVIVRRMIGEASGKRPRCYINGLPATLGQARELASLLIDIHGQHDSLQLLEPSRQRDLLDQYGGCTELRRKVARVYADLSAARRRRAAAAQDSAERERAAAELRSSLDELDRIGFSLDRWNEADSRQRLYHGAAELQEGLARMSAFLTGEEGAVTRIEGARRVASKLARSNPRLESVVQQIDQVLSLVGDLAHETDLLDGGTDGMRDGIEDIEAFLSEAHRLMRRHKCVSPEALAEAADRMQGELDGLEAAADPKRLDERIAALDRKLDRLAQELTRRRKAAAGKIAPAVSATLLELGMPGSSFAIDLQRRDAAAADGREKVRFLIATHRKARPGELRDVASGGELSRVGLAVMALLSGAPETRTMVFDEIDAGIGGEVAIAVGRMLKTLADKCGQVLCVTHLPQIASLADAHWSLELDHAAERPLVRLSRLDGEERRTEMVRMLGGEPVGETARRHADSLLAMGRDGGSRRRR